jgi:hypothetical protein
MGYIYSKTQWFLDGLLIEEEINFRYGEFIYWKVQL